MRKSKMRKLSEFTTLDYMTIALIILAIGRAMTVGNFNNDSVAIILVIIGLVLQFIRIFSNTIKTK